MNHIQKFWLKGGILITAVGLLITGITQTTSLSVNESLSLPYRFFVCVQTTSLKKGQLVVFKGHQTDYFKNMVYAKYVTGLPGDSIRLIEGVLYVGSQSIGAQKKKAKNSKPLTPIQAKTVPEGYVFVSGTSRDSFDSRYEEFGLVKRSCISKKCLGFGRQPSYRT